MKLFNAKAAAIALLACCSGSLMAAEFFLDAGDDLAKGANRADVLVGFSGNGEITDAQTQLKYNPAEVSVSVKALGSAGCSNPRPGLVIVTSPDLGGKALGEKVGAYCQITVKSVNKGALPKNPLALEGVACFSSTGAEASCSSDGVQITK
jgi:hypothetical protein